MSSVRFISCDVSHLFFFIIYSLLSLPFISFPLFLFLSIFHHHSFLFFTNTPLLFSPPLLSFLHHHPLQDLSWEGSELVNLNRNETLFMNAMQAYNKGTPILTDPEFDELKLSLRISNSKIAGECMSRVCVCVCVCD